MTGLLNVMVRASTELKTYFVNVERINEYIELDTEVCAKQMEHFMSMSIKDVIIVFKK